LDLGPILYEFLDALELAVHMDLVKRKFIHSSFERKI
jgi:hypothetical protein